MSRLGDFVRRRRVSLGLTQREIEDRFGIPQAYFSKIERGKIAKPSDDVRRRLARALAVTELEIIAVIEGIGQEDVERWARQLGLPVGDWGDEWFIQLGMELAHDPDDSPRVQLAKRISWITRREAEYLLGVFENLPSEAASKRRDLADNPEELRAWLNAQDDLGDM